jgi:large subunit ribosomal protein L25
MKSVPLKASPRALERRGGSKQLRASGRIPAVIYGRQAQPQKLEISALELKELIKHAASENMLVDLAVQNDARPNRLALVQEIQHHPLSGQVLHVDFHEVAADEKVTINVPVETEGEAEGVKADGGVLEHVLFSVKVRGLPKDLPEVLMVDVSKLRINQAIHLGEIPVPAGIELIGDKSVSVISVAAPKTEEEAAAAETPAAAGEVEMIKEKKEDGAEGQKAPEKGGEKAPAKAGAAPAAGADKKAAPAEKKK